jgi:hypothetical protein
MSDKFPIKVVLVVVALEPLPSQRNNTKFLMDVTDIQDVKLPERFLYGSTTTEIIAANLLEDYTGVTTDWVLLTQLPLNEEDGEAVIVPYCAFIPEPTRSSIDESWLTYDDITAMGVRPCVLTIIKNAIGRSIFT